MWGCPSGREPAPRPPTFPPNSGGDRFWLVEVTEPPAKLEEDWEEFEAGEWVLKGHWLERFTGVGAGPADYIVAEDAVVGVYTNVVVATDIKLDKKVEMSGRGRFIMPTPRQRQVWTLPFTEEARISADLKA